MRSVFFYFKCITSLIGIVFLTAGCEDFIDEPFEQDSFELFSPYDGASVSSENITFWWEKVEDARSYRLIVIKPSFEKAEEIMLDTMLTDVQFNYTLSASSYSWRVDAINYADTLYSQISSFNIYVESDDEEE